MLVVRLVIRGTDGGWRRGGGKGKEGRKKRGTRGHKSGEGRGRGDRKGTRLVKTHHMQKLFHHCLNFDSQSPRNMTNCRTTQAP